MILLILIWFLCCLISVCCPNGTYGPDCDECTGGKERPCKGNGKCRVRTNIEMILCHSILSWLSNYECFRGIRNAIKCLWIHLITLMYILLPVLFWCDIYCDKTRHYEYWVLCIRVCVWDTCVFYSGLCVRYWTTGSWASLTNVHKGGLRHDHFHLYLTGRGHEVRGRWL